MKSRIQSVEVNYFVPATEDPGRLEKALAGLLGKEVPLEAEPMEGHFGNEITRMRAHVTGAEAEAALRRVFSMMPRGLGLEVAASLGSLVDEHSSLFLRFDKQLLVQGKLAPGSGDPVRVKVKPRLYQMGSAAPEFYRRLLEESRAP